MSWMRFPSPEEEEEAAVAAGLHAFCVAEMPFQRGKDLLKTFPERTLPHHQSKKRFHLLASPHPVPRSLSVRVVGYTEFPF